MKAGEFHRSEFDDGIHKNCREIPAENVMSRVEQNAVNFTPVRVTERFAQRPVNFTAPSVTGLVTKQQRNCTHVGDAP